MVPAEYSCSGLVVPSSGSQALRSGSDSDLNVSFSPSSPSSIIHVLRVCGWLFLAKLSERCVYRDVDRATWQVCNAQQIWVGVAKVFFIFYCELLFCVSVCMFTKVCACEEQQMPVCSSWQQMTPIIKRDMEHFSTQSCCVPKRPWWFS